MAMKTHKATAKRITVTGSGKLLKRKAGQGHFNSRESGKVTRNKRMDVGTAPTFSKTMRNLMPYSN
ncbi:MAG: 50S ribosomal protein L35 [Patescibacteria group bacterium]